MDRLSKQSRTPRLTPRAALSSAQCVESCMDLGTALRKLSVRSAKLFVVSTCLSSFATQQADAGCGCSSCAETSNPTCETCAATPRICGLGNGLLDVLDRASGRLESHLFRIRPSSCSCDSHSGTTCDAFSEDAGSSILMDAGQHDSVIQHHTVPSHTHSESRQPSHNPGSSGIMESSPVPVPIPDPIASPPMSSPAPVPVPRAGNPFTDEARSIKIRDEMETPSKIVYSLRSTSTPTLGNIKGDFAKVDVKPVPKHLLRGRSVEKALDSQGIDQQMHAIQSEVVPAASVAPPASNKIQFAR